MQVRAEFRSARRRRALALLIGSPIVFWALANLVAARHERLGIIRAGFFRHVADHAQPVAWTLLLVLVPMLLAVKPKPKRSGAVFAMFTGPVISPLLFGAGGWRLWQIGAFSVLVLWIESGPQDRARRRVVSLEPAEAPADIERSVAASPVASSLHAMSGASFQRRSSS